jgi:streptogramin lyase
VTSAGTFTEVPLPSQNILPEDIAAGPDGALWFTLYDRIGRVTTTGDVSSYRVPTPGSFPLGIAAGPDGALWFVEVRGNRLGRIPVLPTTRRQCTDGGWRGFGTRFKNQGQCVAFVQRGPKP